MLAVLDVPSRHDARGWRQRARIRHQRRRRAHASLGGSEPSAAGGHRLLCRAKVALRDRASLEQLVRLLRVPGCGLEVALRGFAISDGRHAIAFLLAVLESCEELALSDVVAFARVDPDQITSRRARTTASSIAFKSPETRDAGFDRSALDGLHIVAARMIDVGRRSPPEALGPPR